MKFALGFGLYCSLGVWLIVTLTGGWLQPEYAENNLTSWLITIGLWSFAGALAAREVQ